MFKRLLGTFVFALAVAAGFSLHADKASAACMDESGKYDFNHNITLCTDANWYTKNATTVDVSMYMNPYITEKMDWEMVLQIYGANGWTTVSYVRRGYLSGDSPSFRSFNIDDFTWLNPPTFPKYYANARIRVKFTSGLYAGDVYYTYLFRIDDQG
jgi:hypothetical protein